MVRWVRSNFNLESKFKFFIYLCIVIWFLNFPMLYIEITAMNHQILRLERAEDLYNTILEIRRYEKNFFLYKSQDDFESVMHHLEEARKWFTNHHPDFEPLANPSYLQLDQGLTEYRSIFTHINRTLQDPVPGEAKQEKIRTIGKRVVDDAQILLKLERNRISRVVKNALWWPLAFIGSIFFLFLVGASMVTQKVIKPLGKIERATEKIARGDFSPIPHDKRMESKVDHLVMAFNQMVQELEARQEQIIHSRKIASLGTLVSGTAHELNNPINNIILTVDTLVGSRKISEEQRAVLLDDILKQSLRASEIVKNLLDFSRAQTSGYQELELQELLKDTLHISENQMTLSGVHLHDEIDQNLPKITGNRDGLQQVFLNLITNAVQAMPEGGDLVVRAEMENNTKIKVQVRDTGIGIDPEHLPNIFDPFFTTKGVGKGTGLGLSVSYGVIKKHGGTIGVESRKGEGTTFTVILPYRHPDENH